MAALPHLEDPLPLRTQLRERISSATDTLDGLPALIGSLHDADLVGAVAEIEALGRLVDALRVRAAGEVDARSDRFRDDSLSAMHGCRNGTELVERLTRVPTAEVLRRTRLDAATRPSIGLTGEDLPARCPALSAALDAGRIGSDAGALIAGMLARVAHRADPAHLAGAEEAIVDYALGSEGALPPTFSEVRVVTDAWAAALDQDGPEPTAEQAARRREVTIGALKDGLYPVRGGITPEAKGLLQRLFDAHGNPAVRFGLQPEETSADEPWAADEIVHDPRSAGQKRHDILVAVLEAATRAEETPTLGGAAPTLLVHIAVEDLQSPTGIASIDGIDVPVPAATAHRIACTGAVQKVVFDRNGRIVRLGSKERLFNAHQRKAIAARDGGCVIPGCTIPAAWCEIHHVEDHAFGGPTHTDNGVLLCWWHHHHLERSGWEIRMRGGVPEIKAPPWIDRRGVYRPAPTALSRRRARPPAASG